MKLDVQMSKVEEHAFRSQGTHEQIQRTCDSIQEARVRI